MPTVSQTSGETGLKSPVVEAPPRIKIPRPGRLYRRLKRVRRRSPGQPELTEALAAAYGLEVQGQIGAFFGAGRGRITTLMTSEGKKLLKRYKDSVTPEAIAHEHSILTRLRQDRFPAPHLTSTQRGETIWQRAGSSYALFDYLDGYFQLRHYMVLPAQRRRLVALSGQALGSLHHSLMDFTPEGHNANGFKSRKGERWRELGWFMDRLAWCRDHLRQSPGDEAAGMRRSFLSQADRVEKRLQELDEMIGDAHLERLIIHGDYGPHNLFFKRGARVVILDFELARLDWRLTDLAKAFQYFGQRRQGPDITSMRHFLSGYQTYCHVEQAELHLLPQVWQFLTLRRVIVCWHRYCRTGSRHWLSEAESKLALSAWITTKRSALARLGDGRS